MSGTEALSKCVQTSSVPTHAQVSSLLYTIWHFCDHLAPRLPQIHVAGNTVFRHAGAIA